MFERTRRFLSRRAASVRDDAATLVNARQIKQSGGYIARMWHFLVRPSTAVREETFANACLRLGLTEEAMRQTHKFYYIRFYVFTAFFAAQAGIALFSLSDEHFQSMLVSSVGFMALCLAMMVSSSFRLYQIQRRELVDLSVWMSQWRCWIPQPFSPQPAQAGRTAAAPSASALPSPPAVPAKKKQ